MKKPKAELIALAFALPPVLMMVLVWSAWSLQGPIIYWTADLVPIEDAEPTFNLQKEAARVLWRISLILPIAGLCYAAFIGFTQKALEHKTFAKCLAWGCLLAIPVGYLTLLFVELSTGKD